MYISEIQIDAVVKVLKDNKNKLFISPDTVLREIATSIIENLNEVIYYKGT
jgi:hypothetical protein